MELAKQKMKTKINYKIIIGYIAFVLITLLVINPGLFFTEEIIEKKTVQLRSEWILNKQGEKEYLLAHYGAVRFLVPEEYIVSRSYNEDFFKITARWKPRLSFYGAYSKIKEELNSVYKDNKVTLNITYEVQDEKVRSSNNFKYRADSPPGPLEEQEHDNFGYHYYFYYNDFKYYLSCHYNITQSFNTKPTDKCRILFYLHHSVYIVIDFQRDLIAHWPEFGPAFFQWLDSLIYEPGEPLPDFLEQTIE